LAILFKSFISTELSVDTNSSFDIFQKLVPDLVPDILQKSQNGYSLNLPGSNSLQSFGGLAAPLVFGSGNDVIDFAALAKNGDQGGRIAFAGEGNNVILAGQGSDQIFAGAGNDIIEGGNGNNIINAGNGTNLITTGVGQDTIIAGAGKDFIDAGNGQNRVFAGDGDNRILTGTGRDVVVAGSGNDVIYTGDGADTINAGNGTNLINSGLGDDAITLGSGKNRIILETGQGSATINGFTADDQLRLGESLLGKSLSFTTNGRDTLVKSGEDLLATLKGFEKGSQSLVDQGPLTRYTATDLGSLSTDPNGLTSKAPASVNVSSINDFSQIAGRYNTGEVFANTSAAGVANANNPVRQGFIYENGVQTALPSTGIKKGQSDLGAANGATVTLLTPTNNTISNRGDILGTADEVRQPIGKATDRALLWSKEGSGYQLTINDFGGVESYYLDTNNRNQIAGRNIVSEKDGQGVEQTFERAISIKDGVITRLADLGGNGGTAQSLNGQGTIVGYLDQDKALNGEEKYTAVVWKLDASGQYVLENLGTFGAEQARALDINNADQIIGATNSGTGTAATSNPFIVRNGKFTSLGSLGGKTGSANEINEFGQVVGASQATGGSNRAYVWSLGVQSDLNSLITAPLTFNGAAVTLNNAVSINNFGEIVATGTYTYKNAAGVDTVGTRSFLLKEVV
jgi:probable HAF family extracellular repeat protein